MEVELTGESVTHVACDTGIFWRILENKAPWIQDFEAMAKSGVVFSIADHTLAEIVRQLEEGEFTEAEFVRVIGEMQRFISQDVPIVPGKRQLAAWCVNTPNSKDLELDNEYRKASWKHLCDARSLADLEKGLDVRLNDGTQLKAVWNKGAAAKSLETDRLHWIAHIEEKRPGWDAMTAAERLKSLAEDGGEDLDCTPALEVRLHAAALHEVEVVKKRNNAKAPLNPSSKKRKNDGIDYNMSYVFMKRILLCTADDKYKNSIRALPSFQAGWIYTPDELVAAWKSGNLSKPLWPQGA